MMKRRYFLKQTAITAASAAAATAAIKQRPPNIIFILADDLGWAELGCYGNTYNETPNLDRLAKEGMRFTNAYAAAPVCSPYRASLMTGQSPARVGITDYLRPSTDTHLPYDMTTMPEMFKQAGYTTGMTGKWHLSGYQKKSGVKSGPEKHGFDEVMISEQTGIAGGSYFHPYKRVSLKIKPVLGDKEYLTDRLNYEAVEFIERNKDKPFFLYKSHYSVHAKLVGKPELTEHFSKKPNKGPKTNHPGLAAMLLSIDQGLGMIFDKLEKEGLADNTIVIFTSDNGGDGRYISNTPLRDAKSSTYEGGIREPLIVKWPGTVAPGTICNEPTINTDFYPTFTEMIGGQKPAHKLEGKSIVPLLLGKSMKERPFFWHYPLEKPHFLGGKSSGAIRLGNWKLIEFFETQKLELYNLAEDIGEEKDLAGKHPEKVKALHSMLATWRKDVGAVIPDNQQYATP